MRLRQHILDEKVVFQDKKISDAVFAMLYKQCQPYLKDCKKNGNNMLFRGFVRPNGDLFIRTPRQDRRPSDSSKIWHDALDIASKKKFGVKMRSQGLFCKLVTPTGYGTEYMPIPTGNYFCIWNPNVSDAYFFEPNLHPEDTVDDIMPAAENIIKGYQKGSLVDAVRGIGDKKTEVALICDRYYALKVNYYSQIQDWIHNEI